MFLKEYMEEKARKKPIRGIEPLTY